MRVSESLMQHRWVLTWILKWMEGLPQGPFRRAIWSQDWFAPPRHRQHGRPCIILGGVSRFWGLGIPYSPLNYSANTTASMFPGAGLMTFNTVGVSTSSLLQRLH